MIRSDQIGRVEQALSNALSGVHFEPDQPRRQPSGPDLVMVHAPSRFAVEIGSVTAPRIADVIGRVAAGTLELRSWCERHGESPLVVVLVPSWGGRMIGAVRDFVAKHAPDVSWALVGPRGDCHVDLHGTANGDVVSDFEIDVPRPPIRRAGSHGTLFTDLNRWMIKLLLMRHAPADRWTGFRGRIASPTELSRVADVSVETAHRFARTFTANGYLRVGAGDLVVVRAGDLLEEWLAEERRISPALIHVRSIDGGAVDLARAVSPRGERNVALGGLEACRRHGMLHTTSSEPLIHVAGPSSDFVAELDLEFCAEHESQVVIVEPRFEVSVFRGIGMLAGLPVVDLVQAALDVAPLGGRGIEQAELIFDQILSWSDE